MKIIDAFCGIGPTRQKSPVVPSTPQQTLAVMDHCGVDRALVYDRRSAANGDPFAGNAMVCKLAASNPRFLPAFTFGLAPFDSSPSPRDVLDSMREANCRAAWLWPLSQVKAARWIYGDILALCQETDVPLFVSAAVHTPDDIYRMGSAHPRLRLVLAGMDYVADPWLYPLLRQLPELRVCFGPYYIPSGGIERFTRHFGARRILFGSGLPEYGPGGPIGTVTYADVSPEDKALILGGNLEALLGEANP